VTPWTAFTSCRRPRSSETRTASPGASNASWCRCDEEGMTASRTPTLAEVLRRAMDRCVADLRVSLPARVTRYDASKRLCDAQPLLRETYTDADDKPMNVSLPVVTNVPVVFPGAGGFSVTFPVESGDIVLL